MTRGELRLSLKGVMGMTRLEKLIERGVEIFDRMPEGWQEVKGSMTAPRGYYWTEKRVSRFNPQHRSALIKKGA